jgi:hypothetical protein
MTAADRISSAAAARTAGSSDPTSVSNPAITRFSQIAASDPIATHTAINARPRRTTGGRMSPGRAPSAIRMDDPVPEADARPGLIE